MPSCIRRPVSWRAAPWKLAYLRINICLKELRNISISKLIWKEIVYFFLNGRVLLREWLQFISYIFYFIKIEHSRKDTVVLPVKLQKLQAFRDFNFSKIENASKVNFPGDVCEFHSTVCRTVQCRYLGAWGRDLDVRSGGLICVSPRHFPEET